MLRCNACCVLCKLIVVPAAEDQHIHKGGELVDDLPMGQMHGLGNDPAHLRMSAERPNPVVTNCRGEDLQYAGQDLRVHSFNAIVRQAHVQQFLDTTHIAHTRTTCTLDAPHR